MRYNVENIKRIILYPAESGKAFMGINYKDKTRYLLEFEDYITPYYALEELMEELKNYINSTRIGYLFARTATYDVLQLFDSDDEADYLQAQLYLKDRVKLDNIWEGDNNKNFSLERMMAVTDERIPKIAPTIYFNIS
jgi:hypothetical protein